MAKFQTVITHKPKTFLELFGFRVEFVPDEQGFCEFEVPDDRTEVIDRLNEIPEGFVQVGAAKFTPKKLAENVDEFVIEVDGEKVDVSKLDKDNLMNLAKHLGLAPHPNTGIDKLRTAVIEASKAE